MLLFFGLPWAESRSSPPPQPAPLDRRYYNSCATRLIQIEQQAGDSAQVSPPRVHFGLKFPDALRLSSEEQNAPKLVSSSPATLTSYIPKSESLRYACCAGSASTSSSPRSRPAAASLWPTRVATNCRTPLGRTVPGDLWQVRSRRSPSGSCVSMVRNHYDHWLHGKPGFEHLRDNTFELCEYLAGHRQGTQSRW